MSEIIKTFKFESEGVEFLLHIKKGVHPTYSGVTIYIDGELKSNNSELEVINSNKDLSTITELMYKQNKVFWMSFSPSIEKGLRWGNYGNVTGISICNSTSEMNESCLKKCDYIPLIGDYFMESIKKVKKKMILFEISLNECSFNNK